MPSEREQMEILGMMSAHESALADLYRAYARGIPSHAEFFEGLVGDEVKHARMIAGFVDQVKAGTVEVNPGRFSSASVLSSLDFVRQQVVEAERGQIAAREALSMAKDLEDALIERRYFEVFGEDGPELTRLLTTLQEETEAHRRRVGEALEGERG
jgi:rubrerythrin